MKRASLKALLVLICLALSGFYSALEAEDTVQEGEKILSLTGVLRTSYALGGDTAAVKQTGEAIYLFHGDTNKAQATLKNILIEHKPDTRSLNDNEEVNIIIFRGVLPSLCKIELTKATSNDNSFEVYAKYLDITELNTPSQPAVIIPVGKLPIGKYSVVLYVDGEFRKKAEFTIRRAPFTIDLSKRKR